MSIRSAAARRSYPNPPPRPRRRPRPHSPKMASPEDLIAPKPPQLFEARRKIFPKAVRGSYRNLKWAIMAVTLAIYYVTPWLRWDRGPYAPDQAVLVDIANRRFFMFSIEIWPHEFYYVAG